MARRPNLLAACLTIVLAASCSRSSGAAPPPPPREPLLRRQGTNDFRIGEILISPSRASLSFPASINLTDAVVEYALVSRDGKTHESLLTTAVPPRDLHLASLLLGAGSFPDLGATNVPLPAPAASRVSIRVEWTPEVSRTNRTVPLERLLFLGPRDSQSRTGAMAAAWWSYTGSFVHEGRFVAQEEGSIISLIRDPVALINNPGVDRDDDDIHYPDPKAVPPRGTEVRVHWEFPAAERPARR